MYKNNSNDEVYVTFGVFILFLTSCRLFFPERGIRNEDGSKILVQIRRDHFN